MTPAAALAAAKQLLSARIAPATPRTFLAFDQLFGERVGQGGTGRFGMHPAYNAGNEFLDPATADFDQGWQRPIHEGATRNAARPWHAAGYPLVTLDFEYRWPGYPGKVEAGFGQPVPDLRNYFRDAIQLVKWIHDERPGLRVLLYGMPPCAAWNPGDTAAERAVMNRYDDDAAELAYHADGISVSLYNSEDPGRRDMWFGYAATRIQQARKYGKMVLAEQSIHPYNASEDLHQTRDPAALAAEIRHVVTPVAQGGAGADGTDLWGLAKALTPQLNDAIAGALN